MPRSGRGGRRGRGPRRLALRHAGAHFGGQHSYTWEEVVEAERIGKPVLPFLVDENVPWGQPKETDRLNEPDADADAILARVALLRELKDRLRRRSCGAFSTPEDLAAKVVADLGRHVSEQAPAARPTRWTPCHVHALQPARRFAGRESLLRELSAWWADPAALVAPGGTGKTALVERVVHTAPGPTSSSNRRLRTSPGEKWSRAGRSRRSRPRFGAPCRTCW